MGLINCASCSKDMGPLYNHLVCAECCRKAKALDEIMAILPAERLKIFVTQLRNIEIRYRHIKFDIIWNFDKVAEIMREVQGE